MRLTTLVYSLTVSVYILCSFWSKEKGMRKSDEVKNYYTCTIQIQGTSIGTPLASLFYHRFDFTYIPSC